MSPANPDFLTSNEKNGVSGRHLRCQLKILSNKTGADETLNASLSFGETLRQRACCAVGLVHVLEVRARAPFL
jgi:hypothetical protein